MNPIAIGMMVLGVVLLVLGILLVAKRSRPAGLVVCLLGIGTAAVPFVITLMLNG